MEPRDVTHFESREAFRRWLEKNHAVCAELWVGYWKKATGRPSVTWAETVDEALCFGWIDGIRKRIDDDAYTTRFTPRRARSNWSERNLERFAELAKAGQVAPAGYAAHEHRGAAQAKAESVAQPKPVRLSADYIARLKSNPAAWRDWQARPAGYRRLVAGWIMSAKREDTRQRRLNALIEDSAAGRKVKPLR